MFTYWKVLKKFKSILNHLILSNILGTTKGGGVPHYDPPDFKKIKNKRYVRIFIIKYKISINNLKNSKLKNFSSI